MAPSSAVDSAPLDLGAAELEEPYVRDAVWRQARAGDVLDLERLAQREGAAVLLRVVEAGGEAARVALLALPWAPDADYALGPLCDWVKRYRTEPPEVLLRSLHTIAAEPPEQTERPWRDRVEQCQRDLRAWQPAGLSLEARDLRQSTLASLEERRRALGPLPVP